MGSYAKYRDVFEKNEDQIMNVYRHFRDFDTFAEMKKAGISPAARLEALITDANQLFYRGPDEYHELDGWVAGARVGYSPVTLTFSPQKEISSQPDSLRGVTSSLVNMYDIQLTPPNVEG